MKNSKRNLTVASVALIVIIVSAVMLYAAHKQKDSDSTWNTYTNSEYGFSIQYPLTWEATIEQQPSSPNGEFSLSLAQQLRSKPAIVDGVEVDPPCVVYINVFPRIMETGQEPPVNSQILPFDQYAAYFFKDRGGITSTTTVGGIKGVASGDTYLLPYKNDAVMFYWEGYDMKEGVDISQPQIDQHENGCAAAYDDIVPTFKFTK